MDASRATSQLVETPAVGESPYSLRDDIGSSSRDEIGSSSRDEIGSSSRDAISSSSRDEIGSSSKLDGDALEAWRSYLQSHATILRMLDAELVSEHGITTRDYEVLLYLAQAPERKLPMSALAESTMLTRSGITRLVDGLVAGGLIRRAACQSDARVSYAQLTDEGLAKLREAGCTHVRGIHRLFLEHFSEEETGQLASLLERLPGAQRGPSCTVE